MRSDFYNRAAFETIKPKKQKAPIIFNSAHSGNDYPFRFLQISQLDNFSIRFSEDAYIDELFENAPKIGLPLLKALFPRAYLDVNREPYELDQNMFSDILPAHYNVNSARVKAGLGTIAKIVAPNKEIYNKKLSLKDAQMRIEGIYRPYHLTLQNLLKQIASDFGLAILIDCHSMPSLRTSRIKKAPDIVLGDRFGKSCAPQIIDLAEVIFSGAGLKVVRNHPYAGGFITQSYGKPEYNIHALQIEISRHLYMNENSLKPNKNFNAMKKIVDDFIVAIAQLKITKTSFNEEKYFEAKAAE